MSAAVSLPPVLRTCDEDGTHHFSHVKKVEFSGAHYLHAVNEKNEPTRPMLVSTAVHQIILGPREDKKVVVYPGEARRGNEWKLFAARHANDEILTQPEWKDAEVAAEGIAQDPLLRRYLDGARTEVPLTWKDGDLLCSTSGIDILNDGWVVDLKGTNNASPDAWKRTAFRMFYHCQLAWYRRGCVANGIDCSKGLVALGYEMCPPYAVVPLEMTEELIDLGDRTLSLWIEKLRSYKLSIPEPRSPKDWPAYTQSPVPWATPAWMTNGDDEDE